MILCFDDNPDGKAYLTEVIDRTTPNIFVNIYLLAPYLKEHDHICIVEDDMYYRFGDVDFSTYAPFSVIIEMGDKVNVNKL